MRVRELRRDARRRRRDSVFAQLEQPWSRATTTPTGSSWGCYGRWPTSCSSARGSFEHRRRARGARSRSIHLPRTHTPELRASLDLPPTPEIAVLCGWGHIDPDHPVLRGRALVLTSDRGVTRLENRLPDTAVVVSLGRRLRFTGDVIIDALRERGHRRILCEAGPHTFGALLQAGQVDELFLTTSPFLAGDAGEGSRFRLVEGADLVPLAETRLLSIRRHGDHLFARYAIDA